MSSIPWANLDVSIDAVTALRIKPTAIDVTWQEIREVSCGRDVCDLPHETEIGLVSASITPDAEFYRDLAALFAQLAEEVQCPVVAE